MRVALNYLHVIGKSTPEAPDPAYYAPFHNRFWKTYREFKPAIPHELHVTFCGPGSEGRTHSYTGGGWDIGAHQHAAKEIDADFIVFLATPVYFWKHGWLERLVEARQRFGDGLYGPMASYENAPHVRTSCFGTSPALMASWPTLVDNREKCAAFESWPPLNFSRHVMKLGKPVKMVTQDECYDWTDWRKPENIFRRGDQTNTLVRDRHWDIYHDADPAGKEKLSMAADGKA